MCYLYLRSCLLFVVVFITFISNIFLSSIFENNNGTNGVVSLGYAPFSFYGRNIFTRNEGTSALRVSKSCEQEHI